MVLNTKSKNTTNKIQHLYPKMLPKLVLTALFAIIPNVTEINENNPLFENNKSEEIVSNQKSLEKISKEYQVNKEKWEDLYGKELKNKLKSLRRELQRKGHSEREVKKLLSDTKINKEVCEKFEKNILKSTDKGKISFKEFSERIGLDWFVNNAQNFADKYENTLKKIERQDSVDLRYIVGILGIETKFGNQENSGEYNLVNSLVTQYTLVDSRKEDALRDLDCVLKLNKNFEGDITQIKGSYAGAIGVGQWLPSSIYWYGENIEKIDDLFSVKKMIPCVSNYLKQHGWNPAENGKGLDKEKANWYAVKAYNHSKSYVKAVERIAKGVEKTSEKRQKPIPKSSLEERLSPER